jgi:hypothetical protein
MRSGLSESLRRAPPHDGRRFRLHERFGTGQLSVRAVARLTPLAWCTENDERRETRTFKMWFPPRAGPRIQLSFRIRKSDPEFC